MERKKRQVSLAPINGISIAYGTINSKEPKVVYLTGRSWVKPLFEHDYEESLDEIKYNMKRRLNKAIISTESISNRFIFDFSLTAINMKPGKSKFLQFQVFISQQGENLIPFNAMRKIVDDTIVPAVFDMADDFNDNGYALSMTNEKDNRKTTKQSDIVCS